MRLNLSCALLTLLFGVAGTTASFGAQRAIFQLKNDITAGEVAAYGIKAFVLNFGDEETGISEIHLSDPSNTFWYTLDGVRLNGQPTATGLYISKGKKVLIK